MGAGLRRINPAPRPARTLAQVAVPREARRTVGPRRRALLAAGLGCGVRVSEAAAPAAKAVPILVYHRLAAEPRDSMTIRQARFERHLAVLERLACPIVTLAEVVAWRRGERALPARAVALCADDGHRSQAERLVPALRERRWPLTLFIYPSAISNAPYAMTWEQLQRLASDACISVQSHTGWHPNFARDRARLPAPAFEAEVDHQLRDSKALLERRLGHRVTLLAWPFGIADEALAARAVACAYEAAFILGNRAATRRDPPYALPRHLMVDTVDEQQLGQRLLAAFGDEGIR